MSLNFAQVEFKYSELALRPRRAGVREGGREGGSAGSDTDRERE